MDEIIVSALHNASKKASLLNSLTQKAVFFFRIYANGFSLKHVSSFLLNADAEAIFIVNYL